MNYKADYDEFSTYSYHEANAFRAPKWYLKKKAKHILTSKGEVPAKHLYRVDGKPEFSIFQREPRKNLEDILRRADDNLFVPKPSVNKNRDAIKSTFDLDALENSLKTISDVDSDLYVALDCEFVGVGPRGSTDALGRVALVNYYGEVIFDVFVKPTEQVTNYRSWVSGVTRNLAAKGVDPFTARCMVESNIKGKVVLGHNIKSDFRVLEIGHPADSTIDTQILERFVEDHRISKTPSLANVCRHYFGLPIQQGPHSPVEDTRATMLIFRAFKDEFLSRHKKADTPRAEAIQ